MSGRRWSSPFRWLSGSSGQRDSSGRRRGFALRFLARAALLYPALYLIWLPLQESALRGFTALGERIMFLLGRPPLITSLASHGNIVDIHGTFSGVDREVVTWNGGDLHIFVVAGLTLALSVPSLRLSTRIRLTALSVALIALVCVSIVIVQVHAVAEMFAISRFGLTLHDARGKAILDWANRLLIFVGMLLLPATLFFVAYVSAWSQDAPTEPQKTPKGRTRALPRRPQWLRAVLPVSMFVAAVGAVILFNAHPSLGGTQEIAEDWRRILRLNPSSALAQMNVGAQEEAAGHLDAALLLYEGAVRSDDSRGEAHYNLGNALVKKGRYEDAKRSFEEAVKRLPEHASAEKNLGATLLQLHRECEALPHLRRSMVLDQQKAKDPVLQREVSRLQSLCPST